VEGGLKKTRKKGGHEKKGRRTRLGVTREFHDCDGGDEWLGEKLH